MRRFTGLTIAAFALAALALSACGGGTDDASEPAASSEPVAAAEPAIAERPAESGESSSPPSQEVVEPADQVRAESAPDASAEVAVAELPELLQALLDAGRLRLGVVGAAMAVRAPALGTWVGASGSSDRDGNIPTEPDHLFRVGDMSIPLVAALMLQLAEEGVLSLDDPLSAYVADFPNGDEITLRQLLNHTSGVVDLFDDRVGVAREVSERPNKVWTAEEVVASTTAAPPYFEPGAGWRFSRTGYILLGMVVEAATGSPLSVELRRRFFEPLELSHTFIAEADTDPGSIVEGFDVFGRFFGPYTAWNTALGAATGAMVSSAGDTVRWVEALFSGSLLSDASSAEMLTFVEEFLPPGFGYGLGIARLETGLGVMLTHVSEGPPGFASAMSYWPEHDIAVVVLANTGDASFIDFFVEVAGLVLQQQG